METPLLPAGKPRRAVPLRFPRYEALTEALFPATRWYQQLLPYVLVLAPVAYSMFQTYFSSLELPIASCSYGLYEEVAVAVNVSSCVYYNGDSTTIEVAAPFSGESSVVWIGVVSCVFVGASLATNVGLMRARHRRARHMLARGVYLSNHKTSAIWSLSSLAFTLIYWSYTMSNTVHQTASLSPGIELACPPNEYGWTFDCYFATPESSYDKTSEWSIIQDALVYLLIYSAAFAHLLQSADNAYAEITVKVLIKRDDNEAVLEALSEVRWQLDARKLDDIVEGWKKAQLKKKREDRVVPTLEGYWLGYALRWWPDDIDERIPETLLRASRAKKLIKPLQRADPAPAPAASSPSSVEIEESPESEQ